MDCRSLAISLSRGSYLTGCCSVEVEATAIADVAIVTPRRFGDHRGYFSEVFKAGWFRQNISDTEFIQDNQSLSAQVGTVRGLHFQTDPFAQGKLVRCLAGALFDVAVDIRRGSPTFGKWVGVELTPDNGKQLWVPAGFAHGFCTLLPDTVIHYKVTAPYSPECDAGLAWDDPEIGIEWPFEGQAVLSEKDMKQPRLADLPPVFTYSS
jgi:dTDP-4-dehydrorhamnose 3,5-epimerase